MAATKAGRRNSARDSAHLQDAHDHLVQAGATCDPADAEEAKALSLDQRVEVVRSALWKACRQVAGRVSDWDEMPYAPLNIYDDHAIVRLGNAFYEVPYTVTDAQVIVATRQEWTQVDQTWTPTAEVKSLGDGKVGAYLVIFGDPDHPDLSQARDFFTKKTDFWLDKWATRPMLYNHDVDLPADFDPVVGTWTKTLIDDIGVWGEGELDKAHKYRQMVQKLINTGTLASSSDSAPHLVKRKKAAKNTHEVTRWPIMASSLTPTPAEPRLLPVQTIKAAYKAIGLDLDTLLASPLTAEGDASTAPATGAPAQAGERAQREAALLTALKSLEDTLVEPKTLKDLLAAAKSAVLAGDLDLAETYTKRAQALKSIEDMEAAIAAPTPAPAAPAEQPATPAAPAAKNTTVQRLAFGASADQETPVQSQAPTAVKMWYVKKYGELEAGVDQVCRELYGNDYVHLSWAKMGDFRRYLRTGHYDPTLSRVVLLTPDQVINAVANGVTVGEIKTTMVEAQGELGGYLVPEDFRLELVKRLPGVTVIRRYARVVSTMRDGVTFPTVTGGTNRYVGAVRMYLVDESPLASESATNATFGEVTVPVHTMMGSIDLSKNSLEDAGIDLAGYVGEEMTFAHGIFEDEQFIIGRGTKGPRGILNGATGAPHNADVTQVVSGHASQLTADGVVKIPTKIDKQYRGKAIWLMNKSTREALNLLKDSQNRYLFSNNDNQLAASNEDKLKGALIEESEAMPSVAANTYPIIYGDIGGYTIVDRIGMDMQRYDDSTTAATNSVRIVGRRRVGGDLLQGWRVAVQKVST